MRLVARRILKCRSSGMGWPLRGRGLMTRIPFGRALLVKARLSMTPLVKTPLVALLIHTVLLSVAPPETLFPVGGA
ncbi:hypothetical protein [Arthrobacter sp. D1-17]